jgi:hypothetical protein
MMWMNRLKFSNVYAIGVKRCVNLMAGEIHGLKSNDYYIIIERELPVMWLMDTSIWVNKR